MNPSDQEGIDHHVHTGILIEHIDTAYINKDLRVRKSIKKFGDLYLQLKGTNKVWASRSAATFIDSIILSVVHAVVEDSRDRVAKRGRHAPGFSSAYQQKYELDTSEDDDGSDEDDWPGPVANSINHEAAKAEILSLLNLKREPTKGLLEAIDQSVAGTQKAEIRESETVGKKPRKA